MRNKDFLLSILAKTCWGAWFISAHLTARINVEPPQIIQAPLAVPTTFSRARSRCIQRAACARRKRDAKLKNRCISAAKNRKQPGSASKGGRVTVFVCQHTRGAIGASGRGTAPKVPPSTSRKHTRRSMMVMRADSISVRLWFSTTALALMSACSQLRNFSLWCPAFETK